MTPQECSDELLFGSGMLYALEAQNLVMRWHICLNVACSIAVASGDLILSNMR